MKLFSLALIATLLTAFTIQDAAASRPRLDAGVSTRADSTSPEATDPAASNTRYRRVPSRKERSDAASASARPIAVAKPSRSDITAARKAALQAKADASARANRLYDASQLSAPIIVNAKACKRTGENGESIYENC